MKKTPDDVAKLFTDGRSGEEEDDHLLYRLSAKQAAWLFKLAGSDVRYSTNGDVVTSGQFERDGSSYEWVARMTRHGKHSLRLWSGSCIIGCK